jgi:hypothetical protein
MPYKNPERKRQWEREHREERNAKHRKPRVAEPVVPSRGCSSKSTADIVAALRTGRKPEWKAILACAVGIGVVLLAALASVNLPDPASLQLSGTAQCFAHCGRPWTHFGRVNATSRPALFRQSSSRGNLQSL